MARILVADDEEPQRELVVRLLELKGYLVEQARTGKDALVAATFGNPPDPVITDIGMPDLDGIEVIAVLRQLRPDLTLVHQVSGKTN